MTIEGEKCFFERRGGPVWSQSHQKIFEIFKVDRRGRIQSYEDIASFLITCREEKDTETKKELRNGERNRTKRSGE